MRSHWKLGFLLLVLIMAVVPVIAGCSSSAPASPTTASEPTKAPAAAPKATEPAKPAASPAASSASEKPAAKAPSGEPYTIGFVNSFSGYMSSMGMPERDAVLMLADQVNASGGINGRPLKIIAYDDESNESKGVLAVKKLIEQDKVIGIIGTAASGVAMAEVPVIEAAKVPFVAMNSSAAILTPAKKWVFKMPLSEKVYIGAMYQYMEGKGYKKIALLTQGAGFGKEALKYFNDTAQSKGFTIVASESYGPNDTDMTPTLTKIKAANPDILVVYGAEPAGAIAVRQAKEIGIKAPIIGPDSLTMASILSVKELRDGLNGFLVADHKTDVWQQLPDTDRQKKAIAALDAALQKKYNHGVSNWEGIANDVFWTMIDALKKANPDTSNLDAARAKLRDAIESTKDFVGASNIVSYTAEQHEVPTTESVVISQIEDGKFKLVQTIK